ncbi:IS1595 family transposase [Candidatus Nucleicultrix amoebiphila]|uniref:Transposase n=1 Tax=Candidatus Nucleicultrix amoebiphila FS5 TaxID=1414854 RepID=A0A1W6N5H1_9PROT|nr:IS1595 family transposase [Candidatus Nucleicultrix amoebiphila]ARN84299.1 transposase [Candidatus Nucleicultrix amoebiphila FS5]ARN84846.1 transposase [Candidatus Nucleicultrix amoebiphila FS5]ARN85009.1 transposase [Candidatus Nucleicultrix amoebiphila FS5]
MYERKSRLRASQQSKLIEHFVAGTTARAASELIGIQANTAITFYRRLRKLIASKLPSYELSGEVEADESYFGGVRKGKRGRGAGGKVAVFGLLKRGGKVYTAIISDAKTDTLLPIIKEKVQPDSIVYTDTFRSYNALDISDFHHRRINHSQLFADKHNHINGIENFWNQAKRQMRKFNGIKKENFYWFLKECEWRFNGGNHRDLLTQLKSWYRATRH